jgi:hypothetical protein
MMLQKRSLRLTDYNADIPMNKYLRSLKRLQRGSSCWWTTCQQRLSLRSTMCPVGPSFIMPPTTTERLLKSVNEWPKRIQRLCSFGHPTTWIRFFTLLHLALRETQRTKRNEALKLRYLVKEYPINGMETCLTKKTSLNGSSCRADMLHTCSESHKTPRW